MRRLWIVMAGLWIVCGSVWAQTTGEMLSDCRPWTIAHVTEDMVARQEGDGPQRCWGAFGTVQSGVMLLNGDGRRLWAACVPEEKIRRTQLIAIFVRYAEQIPSRWHEDFLVPAIESLQAAFPCARKR